MGNASRKSLSQEPFPAGRHRSTSSPLLFLPLARPRVSEYKLPFLAVRPRMSCLTMIIEGRSPFSTDLSSLRPEFFQMSSPKTHVILIPPLSRHGTFVPSLFCQHLASTRFENVFCRFSLPWKFVFLMNNMLRFYLPRLSPPSFLGGNVTLAAHSTPHLISTYLQKAFP